MIKRTLIKLEKEVEKDEKAFCTKYERIKHLKAFLSESSTLFLYIFQNKSSNPLSNAFFFIAVLQVFFLKKNEGLIGFG